MLGTGATAGRWGQHGHEISAQAAATALPADMPDFFRAAADQLIYLNPEPDRWRRDSLDAMNEAFRYDHYIDIEVVPASALAARDRYQYLAILHDSTDLARPARDAGLLPFHILELYQRLEIEFALWRAASDSTRRSYIEERIIQDAGILGHFVTDGANPQHTSVHHNGWAEGYPNPHGYTLERNFHRRFESRFVEAQISAADVRARMSAHPRALSNVRNDVWEYLRASHGQIERLYQLEQAASFDATNTLPSHREFAIQRLAAGSEMLRALWYHAWLASGVE